MILKDEIQRLAKKEINQAVSALRKSNSVLRKTVTEHKRHIAALASENKKLSAQQGKIQKQTQPTVPAQEGGDIWIYSKGIKGLRRRLGISQVELAKLVCASMNTVTLWERKASRVKIRKLEVRRALIELKGMKKAEV